jgi:hypothetical protein
MKLGLVASSIALLALRPVDSRAEEPTPSSCRVSPIVVCPAGDFHIDILVRKGHTPLSEALVTLDLNTCAELKMGAPLSSDSQAVEDGIRQAKPSGADGHVVFAFRAGGASACSRAAVLVDGFLIAERSAVASPDQNGDLTVDQADLDLMRSKIGTKDPTADLDGDGRVTPSDLLTARLHLGHHADIATPTKVTTWGEIKEGYR